MLIYCSLKHHVDSCSLSQSHLLSHAGNAQQHRGRDGGCEFSLAAHTAACLQATASEILIPIVDFPVPFFSFLNFPLLFQPVCKYICFSSKKPSLAQLAGELFVELCSSVLASLSAPGALAPPQRGFTPAILELGIAALLLQYCSAVSCRKAASVAERFKCVATNQGNPYCLRIRS